MAISSATALSSPSSLISHLLSTIEDHIIPLTRTGVSSCYKVCGAAILLRTSLTPYTLATNNEHVSPLLHGEINCIQPFFTTDFPDPATRPDPKKDCVFLATHEPCSLCLSGITWSGFSKFYYLFTYEDSRDLFSIPNDIDILQEVFQVRDGNPPKEQIQRRPLYNRVNKFFTAMSFMDVVGKLESEEERRKWTGEIESVKGLYESLNGMYQEGKKGGVETSSIWQ